MTIHRKSALSLIEYVNKANSSNLTVADVDIGVPSPIAGTWREGLVDRNTVVRLTTKETSAYKGTRVVCYDRLDLNGLDLLFGIKIKCYQPKSTHDLLKPILLRYGIFIDAEDVEDVPIEQTDTGPNYFTLTAKSTALGWLGEVTLESTSGAAVLGDHLTTLFLPGLNYPTEGDGSQGSALMYWYPYDFTDYKSALETFEEGYVFGQYTTTSEEVWPELPEGETEHPEGTVPETVVTRVYAEADLAFIEMLNSMDKGAGASLWSLDDTATAYSLAGAEVVYSGINSELLPTKSSAKYVLGVALREDVLTPPGAFYLHYSDPFDPDAV